MASQPAKSNAKVCRTLNLYADWRLRRSPAVFCREDPDGPPPEKLLQGIWLHQRLLRDRLTLPDETPVRILHPGFRNRESGPDFRAAVIQFGSSAPRSGDVEIDLQPAQWRHHGHDRNPAFRNVILHVVWEPATTLPPGPPTVSLKPVLDAPLHELSAFLGPEPLAGVPPTQAGMCSGPVHELDPAQITQLLEQAARVRLETKARQIQARARQAGWDQALWEGIFRATGYKHNVWPMQCLAEQLPRLIAARADAAADVLTLQARLLGLAGLLPPDLTRERPATDRYVRSLWDVWWRERETWSEHQLPRSVWHLHGLRPANHPARRLALIAHWLADPKFIERLRQWFMADHPSPAATGETLLQSLQAGEDEFWSRHWTFRSARLRSPTPLLGAPRTTDLAMNAILPWFWARAMEGRNQELQQRAEVRYFAWLPAQDNAVMRLARQRLFGRDPGCLRRAALQQGLMQIVRDFCDHSNALCDECSFPQLVLQF